MRDFDYTALERMTWTTDILNLIARIHECKGREELFVRQKPAELTRLIEIARIQSTEASNAIEGIVTTETRMKQLFAEKTTPRNRDESEIMGYRDVLNTVHESHDYIPVRAQYILQLHRDMMRRAGISHGGKFKNVQNYINEMREDGTVVTRFTPLAPYETPDAVERLCRSYEAAVARESVDALLLIPIFICDFLCIHPFNDGNGRMSRLLTLLLLYKAGYGVGKYISIERQIEKTKEFYYEALQAADEGWIDGANDPTPFIRYLLQVILACYTDFEERVGMMRALGIGSSAYDIVRQYAAEQLGPFTSADAVARCPSLGRASILAALKRLTEEGILLRRGKGRSTCYLRNVETEIDKV